MKRINTVRQHDTRDCGAACLCMICNYFKRGYSIQQLRQLTNTSQEGVSIWGMVEAAEKIGFTANGYFGRTNDLKEFTREVSDPVVLHMKNNHFVVGYKFDNRSIYIQDPAKGKYKVSWDELEGIWSGYIISFQDKDDKSAVVKAEKKKDRYAVIKKLVREHIPTLFIIVVLSLLILTITICSNYVFQVLIDNGGILHYERYHNHSTENFFLQLLERISGNSMYTLAIFMILFFAIMVVVMWIRGRCVALMSKKIDVTLVRHYTNKISNSTIHAINSRMQGEYMTRISDLVSLRRFFSDLFVAVILDIAMIVSSIYILVRTNKYLFLISMGGIILYVMVALLLKTRIKNANYRIANDNADMQSFFKEFIHGIEVIKANNESEKVVEKFLIKYEKYVDSVYYGSMIGVTSISLYTFIEQVSSILVVIIGFIFVEGNLITLGELFSFYLFLACMTEPIKDILSFQSTFQSGIVALERLEDIRYMEEERITGQPLPEQEMSIEVQNVSFNYPGKSKLLKNISFDISGADKVVICGDNGSGKSTLLKLIMGIERASEGIIKINGFDVKDLDLSDLRSKISYVTQTNFLFADTLMLRPSQPDLQLT